MVRATCPACAVDFSARCLLALEPGVSARMQRRAAGDALDLLCGRAKCLIAMMSSGSQLAEHSRAHAAPARYEDVVIGAQLHRGDVSGLFIATRPGVPGARVALARQLHRHVESSPEHCALVEREAALGPRVVSPHVISYTPVQAAPRPLALLEFVEGLSLAQLIAQSERRLEAPRLLMLAVVDVFEGLAALHRLADTHGPLGLVHQAPVPRHVLVGVDGVARLTDLTQCVSRDHPWVSAIAARLSAHELAPEQALAPTHVDARCDLFIASATAFAVLAGRPLFAAADSEAAVQRVLRMSLPSLGELGLHGASRLERLLRRGLARARADRPSSAAEMAQELASAAAQAGLLATRDELAGHVSTARRARMLAAPAVEPTRTALVPVSGHTKTLLGVAVAQAFGHAPDTAPTPQASDAPRAVDRDSRWAPLPAAPIIAVVGTLPPTQPVRGGTEDSLEALEPALLLERARSRPSRAPGSAGSTAAGLGPSSEPTVARSQAPVVEHGPLPDRSAERSAFVAAGRPAQGARSPAHPLGVLGAAALLVGGAWTGFALVQSDWFVGSAELEEREDLARRVRALAQEQATPGLASPSLPTSAQAAPAPALEAPSWFPVDLEEGPSPPAAPLRTGRTAERRGRDPGTPVLRPPGSGRQASPLAVPARARSGKREPPLDQTPPGEPAALPGVAREPPTPAAVEDPDLPTNPY